MFTVRVVEQCVLIGTAPGVEIKTVASRTIRINCSVVRMLPHVARERIFKIPQRIAGLAHPTVHRDAAPVIASGLSYQFGFACRAVQVHFR